jgi:DNA mismatch repair protein MutS
MQDFDDVGVLDSIKAFAQGMRKVREHVAQAEKLYTGSRKRGGSSRQ